MNLLLLLSALLSALTGVGSSARAPQTPAAVSQVARTQAARAAVALVSRPAPAALRPVDVRGDSGTVLTLFPAEPAYAGRRRE